MKETSTKIRVEIDAMHRKSVGAVLVSLRGQEVIAELKNDNTVRGIVDDSDWGMNLVLRNVTLYNRSDGCEIQMEQMMLSGRMLRFVHIPPSVDFRHSVAQYLSATAQVKKKNLPPKIR